MVCESCWLVQTATSRRPDELFSDDYAYFSSFSTSWLEHAERYVEEIVRTTSTLTAKASSWRSPPTTATCCNM